RRFAVALPVWSAPTAAALPARGRRRGTGAGTAPATLQRDRGTRAPSHVLAHFRRANISRRRHSLRLYVARLLRRLSQLEPLRCGRGRALYLRRLGGLRAVMPSPFLREGGVARPARRAPPHRPAQQAPRG